MKHLITVVVAVIVIGVLAAYMVTFTVRYDEVAVRKTFERVDEDSLITEPGLHFRWPWPIQKVETYSKRLQVLEAPLEQVSTADNKTVIVKPFVVWKIDDPYQFAKTIEGGVSGAESRLLPMVKDVIGVIPGKKEAAGGGADAAAGFAWEDLVNRDPGEVKLDAIESAMRDRLRAKLADVDPPYGIAVERVGIRRLTLPGGTGGITEKVAERMVKAQESAASTIEEQAKSNAETIRSRAESDRRRILAWAEQRAERIRAEGDRAAAAGLAALSENEEFATFLREMDTLPKMLAQSPQMILRFDDWRPLQMLRYGPVAVEDERGNLRLVPRREAEDEDLTPARPRDPAPAEPSPGSPGSPGSPDAEDDDPAPLAGDGGDPDAAADEDEADADAASTEAAAEPLAAAATRPAAATADPAALERALDADAAPRVDIAGHNEQPRGDAVAEVETE